MITQTQPMPQPHPVSLKSKRIFVVEDNAENRMVVRMALMPTGAISEFDKWGRETIHRLHQFAPVDLILLDLMLLMGESGYALFAEIRTHQAFATTPIVAVSAADPSQAIPRCRKMGFAGFIAKPIDLESFTSSLSRILAGEQVWQS